MNKNFFEGTFTECLNTLIAEGMVACGKEEQNFVFPEFSKKLFDSPVTFLPLNTKGIHTLQHLHLFPLNARDEGDFTIRRVVNTPLSEIAKVRGCGTSTAKHIKTSIAEYLYSCLSSVEKELFWVDFIALNRPLTESESKQFCCAIA